MIPIRLRPLMVAQPAYSKVFGFSAKSEGL
jgi:hypothetical protein